VRCEELVQGVDRHELNAGKLVDSFAAGDVADGLDHAVGAVVSVVVGVFEKLTLFTDECVVYPPGVEAYAFEVGDWGVVQGFADFGPEAEDVPAEGVWFGDREVGEAGDFLEF
jgi:hypothetical protein